MHFVSYCETELFKKTYRNNLNNVLQNLLNEFYTYAKSAFVTLTKYWTVSLLNLFRFLKYSLQDDLKKGMWTGEIFLYICYRYLLNYVPFLCTENL